MFGSDVWISRSEKLDLTVVLMDLHVKLSCLICSDLK